RGLPGLRPRVAEEHLGRERERDEALGETRRGLGVEEVARVDDPCGLGADGGDDLAVAVTEAVHADARREVEVGLPVAVDETRALPGDEDDLPLVDGQERAHARAPSPARAAPAAPIRVPAKPPSSRALPAITTAGIPAAAASSAVRTLRAMPPP